MIIYVYLTILKTNYYAENNAFWKKKFEILDVNKYILKIIISSQVCKKINSAKNFFPNFHFWDIDLKDDLSDGDGNLDGIKVHARWQYIYWTKIYSW